jgi:hypothetical protein
VDTATLIFPTAGIGQIFQNSQWIADVEYERTAIFAPGGKGLVVVNLTLLCGQLRNAVGRSGIELRTANGSCHSILLPAVSAMSIAQVVVLS